MKVSPNLGVKIWACYFMSTGIYILITIIKYFSEVEISTLFEYIYLSYPFLFSMLLLIVGIGLFKLHKIARKGAMLIACINLIGVIISIPFTVYCVISGKPVLSALLKIVVQSSIATAILLYFNRPSVKSFFEK